MKWFIPVASSYCCLFFLFVGSQGVLRSVVVHAHDLPTSTSGLTSEAGGGGENGETEGGAGRVSGDDGDGGGDDGHDEVMAPAQENGLPGNKIPGSELKNVAWKRGQEKSEGDLEGHVVRENLGSNGFSNHHAESYNEGKSLEFASDSNNKSVETTLSSAGMDGFARIFDSLGDGINQVGHEAAAGEIYQELKDLLPIAQVDPVSISKATFEEKLTIMTNTRTSFAILDKLLAGMQVSDSTFLKPWTDDIKQQVLSADSLVNELISFLSDQQPASDRKKNTKLQYPKNYARTRRLGTESHDLGGLDEEHFFIKGENQSEGASGEQTKVEDGVDAARYTGPKSYKQFFSSDDSEKEEKHWHGFKSHHRYNTWKKMHTRFNPQSNHLFDAFEHIHTGNFEEFHA